MRTTVALFLLALGLLLASAMPQRSRTSASSPSPCKPPTASPGDPDALVEWDACGPRYRKAIEESDVYAFRFSGVEDASGAMWGAGSDVYSTLDIDRADFRLAETASRRIAANCEAAE